MFDKIGWDEIQQGLASNKSKSTDELVPRQVSKCGIVFFGNEKEEIVSVHTTELRVKQARSDVRSRVMFHHHENRSFVRKNNFQPGRGFPQKVFNQNAKPLFFSLKFQINTSHDGAINPQLTSRKMVRLGKSKAFATSERRSKNKALITLVAVKNSTKNYKRTHTHVRTVFACINGVHNMLQGWRGLEPTSVELCLRAFASESCSKIKTNK